MKNNQNDSPGYRRIKKILLFMNLTAICILGALLQVSASVYSQQRFTLRYDNVAVEKLFEEIAAGSNFRFMFNNSSLQKKKVNIHVADATLPEIMDNYLPDLQYRIMENGVVLVAPKNEVLKDFRLKGHVVNDMGQPLPGVTVRIKGTTLGAVTDALGNFELQVPDNAILTFSFIGYKPREIPAGKQETLTIALETDNSGLNEVVVVGYGTQRRERITTAIASVKAEDFVKGAATDAGQLIRGKVAGLSITVPDGNPTSTSQMSLRGISTLKAGVSPLVLIDGVPGSLISVAPEDIESIDVLKDGSAAAIYGTRGTNGVILITTKQVQGETPPTVDLSSYISTQKITKKLNFMNAEQYRKLVQEGKPGATDYGANTNWLDEVTQTPISQVYNLSLKGGNKNTSYIANLNYRNLQGLMKRSDNQVFFPRIEINHQMFDGRLKFNANVSGYQQQFFAGADGNSYRTDVYRNALTYNPTDPLKDPNGKWTEHIDKTDYANPVALLQETQGQNKNTDLRTYGTITFMPVNDLTISLLGSRDVFNSTRGYYESKKHYSTIHDGRNGYASRGTTRNEENLLELTANYQKKIKEHEFTALVGYSWRKFLSDDYWMQNWDFPTDDYTYNKMQSGLALKRGEAPENSSTVENKLVGYFFRLNYAFKGKYMLMASVRHEGSSRFGVNHKWGNFPAISAGWNIKKEGFMENVNVISSLKLRGGFGITGTEPSSNYGSLNLLNFNTYVYYNGQWIQSISQSTNPNPDLRWEKKQETNVGVDFGFLEDRITGSVDIYKRHTTDLLMDYTVPTPPYLYNKMTANAATMDNKGIEVQVNGIPVKTKNFMWSTTVNYSTNKNQLVSLSDKNFSIASGYFDDGDSGEPIQAKFARIQIGNPIGNFWGFKTVDIDKDGHWIIEGKDGKPKPINDQQADDKQVIGNGLPKHFLAWNNTFTYKKLDLNITMRGAFGFQILNTARMWYEQPVMLTRGNVLTTTYDNIYGKRPLADDQSLNYVSYYVENGNYWKIDNITLGYNMTLKNPFIKRIRVYASGSNLITFTKYKGIDPEISAYYGGSALVPGVDDRNRYPATATYTLGAFFTF